MVKFSDGNISVLKRQLYEACFLIQERDQSHVFHQNEFQEFDHISFDNDIQILLRVVQELLDDKLFKMVHDSEGMGWKLRSQEEATKCVNKSSSC